MPNQLIVTDELLDEIAELPYTEQAQWLFLIQSDSFKGFWEVEGLNPWFYADFEDLIGSYRLVSPATINQFLTAAEELGYRCVFMDDPTEILDAFAYLKEPPDVELISTLDNTTNGFLPWQVAGYNKLIRNEDIPGGYFVHCVGSGKTAQITAAILHYQDQFDVALVLVKSHNKIDTQRKLKALGDIDSLIVDGDKKKRLQIYHEAPPVLIMNYEKIREDYEDIIPMIEGKRCLFFFDEASAKLGNRSTQLYKATRKLIYESFPSKPRPSWFRSWALSATPVENSPNDVFSVVNLQNPGVLGTVRQFHDDFVATTNYFSGSPETWKNLDAFEAKLQFMTHRVSKDDPEVSAMFPKIIDRPLSIDWNPKHLSIYNNLTGKAQGLVDLEDANILALIQIMQMMCDAPSMIVSSANNRQQFYNMLEDIEDLDRFPVAQGSDIAIMLVEQLGIEAFTNTGHTKLETWKDIITVRHPTDKIVTHSTWAEYIFPIWEEYLNHWGISYVIYKGTSKEKQAALDAFRDDPSIHCFLSGDAGADSIDIAEAAVGINYNIPWKWTTLEQREGRRDRVTSDFEHIYTYTLTMPYSVDERKMAICEKKYSYHARLFDGKARDEVVSAKFTKEDLLQILFG